jgi:hypothetical protein
MVVDFVCFMNLEGASNTWRKEVMFARCELVYVLRCNIELFKSNNKAVQVQWYMAGWDIFRKQKFK